MEILQFNPESFKIFSLILVRVSAVLFLLPVFGATVWPSLSKAGLSLVLTLLLYPVVPMDPALFPEESAGFLVLVGTELVIGVSMGTLVRIYFAAVQLAGQMIGFQMGFGIINVVDPQSGTQVSIIEQIVYWVALLIFLGLNGHHTMITALVDSFRIIPPGMLSPDRSLLAWMTTVSGDMFALSVKIGAPAIAALLFASAAFGISAKFVPQMNILVAAFPVKIGIGLFFLGLVFEIIHATTRVYVVDLPKLLRTLMAGLG